MNSFSGISVNLDSVVRTPLEISTMPAGMERSRQTRAPWSDKIIFALLVFVIYLYVFLQFMFIFTQSRLCGARPSFLRMLLINMETRLFDVDCVGLGSVVWSGIPIGLCSRELLDMLKIYHRTGGDFSAAVRSDGTWHRCNKVAGLAIAVVVLALASRRPVLEGKIYDTCMALRELQRGS